MALSWLAVGALLLSGEAWAAAPGMPSLNRVDAGASQPKASGYAPTLGEVSQVQAQVYLLQEQLKQAELELKMAHTRAEIQGLRDALRQDAGKTAVVDVGASAPSVLSVQGGAKTNGLTADLRFQDGSIQRVQVGDMLAQGWRVHAISPAQVVLTHEGQGAKILPLRLRPQGVTAIQVPAASATTALALPPVPPLPIIPASEAMPRRSAKIESGLGRNTTIESQRP